MASAKEKDQPFVSALAASQMRLYGYVLSLVGNREQAHDVLQQTNLVLWQRSDDWEPGTNFIAWAMRVAYFEVLAFRRDRVREKLIFDDGLIQRIEQQVNRTAPEAEDRHAALRKCLERLPANHRELIQMRYGEGRDVASLAAELGRKSNTLAQTLHRIRAALLDCIQRTLEVGR